MFKDPIAPKQCKQVTYHRYGDKFLGKGDDYGTGFNVPVGTKGQAKASGNTVPRGVKTMDVSNAEEKYGHSGY